MNTLTSKSSRTIAGYLVSLLEYPRWMLAREIDFTTCHRGGAFTGDDAICSDCQLGESCRWLCRDEPTPAAPLEELVDAVRTSLPFVREYRDPRLPHDPACDCDACTWLREAQGFLRMHRNRG